MHDWELFVVYSGHEMKSLMVVTEQQKYQQTLTIQAWFAMYLIRLGCG